MLIRTVMGSERIPEGAIRLKEREALKYQKELVRDWKKESDVYGRHLASTFVLASSFMTWNHARVKLMAGNSFIVWLSLTSSIFPAMGTMKWFDEKITTNILLMRQSCPMCFQLKYGVFQAIVGIGYPLIMGISSSCVSLSSIKSPHLPDLSKDAVAVYKHIYDKVLKTGVIKYQALITANFLLVFFFSYMQSRELTYISKVMELTARRETEELNDHL